MSRRKEPVIPADLLDQFLAGNDAASALQHGGLLDSLKKALAERALNAEMDYHLGDAAQAGNSRNGYGRKTIVTDTGKIEIEVPRDRQASFDPQLIAKYQRRFPGFDDKIVSMYVRGMRRHEHAGDRGASARSVWHRRLAGPDLDGHRCRARERRGLAGAAARPSLSAGFLRCGPGEEGWDAAFGRFCRSHPCLATEWTLARRPDEPTRTGCGGDAPRLAARLLDYLWARRMGVVGWAFDFPGTLFAAGDPDRPTDFSAWAGTCEASLQPYGNGRMLRDWFHAHPD